MLAAAAEMGGLWETFASLLAYTGCRMSEAARARWTQLELDGEHPVWYVEGKGARRRGPKVRVVPLNAELVDVLHRWRATSDSPDWLFPSDRSVSGHLHQSTLQKRLSEVCEAAEIQRATAHRWRHSVATIALQRTGDLRGVQSLLGHASLATTQIYTKVIPDQLRALVDALGRPA
jgi:integrase/recombinase XerD